MLMLRGFEWLLTALEDLTHDPGRHFEDSFSTQIHRRKKNNINQTELAIGTDFYSCHSLKDAMPTESAAQIVVRVATGADC